MIQIIGCRFHLTQRWRRKIQEIGLTNEYKKKIGECGIWLQNIFGLSFLNPEEVSHCLIEDFMAYSANDPKILTFCDYLTENYIDESSRFTPKIGLIFLLVLSEPQTVMNLFMQDSIHYLQNHTQTFIYLYTF